MTVALRAEFDACRALPGRDCRYASRKRAVTGVWSTCAVTRTRIEIEGRRSASRLRAGLAEDLRRLCDDAGVSQAALSRAAGIPQPFISRIFAGTTRPTVETYVRLATALGADLNARLYPNTGPAIRDRHQAPIVEGILRALDRRWRPSTEVAVRRPARGWIDLVLHDPTERVLVATEIESDIRRIEQTIRWSGAKADALPSWDGWPSLADPTISRLLIVRWTRTTRQIARDFRRQLGVAYPAHPDDAIAALTGRSPWPGPALIWCRLERSGYGLVPG